jgi:hypothetical protein
LLRIYFSGSLDWGLEMPDINDELLALIGQAPEPEPLQSPDLPALDPGMLMSAAAQREVESMAPADGGTGLDAFLVDGPPQPVDEMVSEVNSLEGIWDRPEDRPGEDERGGPIEGADAGLEALFMGGREARDAAEAQGYVPGAMPAAPSSGYEDFSFDTSDLDTGGGGGGASPNPAVRWTVGRQDPPPAAPPMASYRAQGGADGVVVSRREGGQFIVQERPRPAVPPSQSVQAVAHTARAEASPAPAPAPMHNAPTLYDHLLSDD